MKRAFGLMVALSLLAGCAAEGTATGGASVDYYGASYYDDWWYGGGGCCVDYPGDIGPINPHPEHPIANPPGGGNPRPENPIAKPPTAEPKASSTSRSSMPAPRASAPMRGGGGGMRGGGGGRR